MQLAAREESWPYVPQVQMLLAFSTLKVAPSWHLLAIQRTSIKPKPYIEPIAGRHAFA